MVNKTEKVETNPLDAYHLGEGDGGGKVGATGGKELTPKGVSEESQVIANSEPPPPPASSAGQNLLESKGPGAQIVDLQNKVDDLSTQSAQADSELANWQALKQAFVANDKNCPTIKELSDWGNAPGASPELKAAVNWLIANPDKEYAILGRKGTCLDENIGKLNINMLDTTIGLAKANADALHTDLTAATRDLRAQQLAAGVAPGPQPAPGTIPAGTTPTTTTPPTTASASGAATGTAADPNETPRPTPSTMPGLEGADENASRMVTWSETEINRLSAAYSAETDPSKQAQIKTRIDQLTRNLQSISAMESEFATMMSNLLKMYADMAMTAVHNIH